MRSGLILLILRLEKDGERGLQKVPSKVQFQVQPEKATKLSIYPISVEPRAGSPSDMKENYHFEEI